MFSTGSPKNFVAPCVSICSSPRRMMPMLAGLMFPHFGAVVADGIAHVMQHGTQVLEVQQQHAVVVGDLEDEVQHAGLRFVQAQHVAQQGLGSIMKK